MIAVLFFVAVGILIGAGLVGPAWAQWAYREGVRHERERAAVRLDQAVTAARRTWAAQHAVIAHLPAGDAWDRDVRVVTIDHVPFDFEAVERRLAARRDHPAGGDRRWHGD